MSFGKRDLGGSNKEQRSQLIFCGSLGGRLSLDGLIKICPGKSEMLREETTVLSWEPVGSCTVGPVAGLHRRKYHYLDLICNWQIGSFTFL